MAIIKSPIFKDINEYEISEMTAAGFLRARKFRKNSFIYHVTDSVHEIGIVASGQVTIEYIDLWGNKAIMSNISTGHVFAETYALTGEPLMVDAVASETSVILFLDIDKLMSSQFENTHCKIQSLTICCTFPFRRISPCLTGYSAHHLIQSEKGFLYICPMSQEKLAVRNS